MDALWKSLAVILAVVTVVSVVPVMAEDADAAGELNGLMIYEVNPWNDHEGVTLSNYGDTDVNLRDYLLTDNPAMDGGREGTITFTETITVTPGEHVVIASASGSEDENDYVSREGYTVYYIGQHGIESDNFSLANEGDDVYLWNNGHVVDAVCYGDTTIDDSPLWIGDPVGERDDRIIQRHSTEDTDSADDWRTYVPGWTYNEMDSNVKFDATVTPFLFPDSGGIPVYQALLTAAESIYINVYQLSSKNVCALLEDIVSEGNVEVSILVEGTTVDGWSDLERDAPGLIALADAGADVRLIGMGDDARFIQDHAKYAIIDMETVVVTSENWTTDNLNGKLDDNVYSGSEDGNRGWGAVIESAEYAEYMYNIFQNDFSMDYGDVLPIKEVMPEASPASLYYVEPDDAEFESFEAQVTPILSNDNSFDYTEYFIENAQERVYSEQQSLSTTYQDLNYESPLASMAEMAASGVDCKLLIGTGVSNYNSVSYMINSTTEIEAGVVTTPYVHNKGIVADNVAIVSSVNWTPSSFHNNRECAVAIYSEEIADYFAQAFLNDFEHYYDFDGFRASLAGNDDSFPADQEITFSVSVTPAGEYEYTWDFGDGSTPLTTDIPRVSHTPVLDGDTGAFILTVTVSNGVDEPEVRTMEYTVGTTEPEDGFSLDSLGEYGYLIIPIIVIILAIAGAVSRSGKKKSTNRRK